MAVHGVPIYAGCAGFTQRLDATGWCVYAVWHSAMQRQEQLVHGAAHLCDHK